MRPCACKKGRKLKPGEWHHHSPGGGATRLEDGTTTETLPFRPGKTKRDKKKGHTRNGNV